MLIESIRREGKIVPFITDFHRFHSHSNNPYKLLKIVLFVFRYITILHRFLLHFLLFPLFSASKPDFQHSPSLIDIQKAALYSAYREDCNKG